MLFEDRRSAGQILARKLSEYAGRDDVVVLGLPRGGVPVAYEIARRLHAPLDVFLVRKLGVPGQEELAFGAIAPGGVRVLNHRVLESLNIDQQTIDEVAAHESHELERREKVYRGDRPPLGLQDKVVILVDDGLATGSTMRAAVAALRRMGPARIVVAVPVGAVETCEELRSVADDVVCARTPSPFYAVGLWYTNFDQTTDEEVRALLAGAARQEPAA